LDLVDALVRKSRSAAYGSQPLVRAFWAGQEI
jgi:hypothetical protein